MDANSPTITHITQEKRLLYRNLIQYQPKSIQNKILQSHENFIKKGLVPESPKINNTIKSSNQNLEKYDNFKFTEKNMFNWDQKKASQQIKDLNNISIKGLKNFLVKLPKRTDKSKIGQFVGKKIRDKGVFTRYCSGLGTV